MNLNYIVILEDGETFGSLHGVEIAAITDEALARLSGGTKIRHLIEEDEIFHVVGFSRQV